MVSFKRIVTSKKPKKPFPMKKIIVPVDFSETSEHALHAAAKLAKKTNSKIIVLHMLELATVHAYGRETKEQHTAKAIFYIKLAEKKLDAFIQKEYLNGISITPIIRQFKVFSELNEVAEEQKADLIVMGSKGTSGLSEFFVGSNTEKVVRHSQIPVLVIKSDSSQLEFNTVVFATDFSEKAVASFLTFVKTIEPLGAQILLLHVNVPGEGFSTTDAMERKIATFLQKADGNLNRWDDVKFVADHSVEDGIVKFANKVKADLIAIPTHGRTGLSRFFEGSISEDLANHANFPILTVKMDQ